MPTIPRTIIGTSDPVDICKGFALFANDARAIQLGYNVTKTLLAVNPEILAWRFNVDAGYTFFAGVCGPAYAFRFAAEGETTGDRIRLDITNDETAAGFVFGIQAELFLNFSIEQNNIKFIADGWNSRFVNDWATTLSARPTLTVDLLELLLNFIRKFFGSRPNQKDTKLEKTPSSPLKKVTSWGMFDYKAGQFASNGGTLEVTPSVSLPINLVPLTKSFPPPANALYIADEGLQKFWGGLELGPRFTIAIPVTIKMTHITVMNATYRNLTYGGSTVTGTGGREIPGANHMNVGLQESPGFQINFEFFINISVCKLFSFEASVAIANLVGLLGIKIAPGPFAHVAESTIGGGPLVRAHGFPDGRDDLATAEAIEVIFEPVEEVA